MAQKFVGIDMGEHHVKVAVVSAGFRGVQLLDAYEEPVGTPSPRADGEEPDPFNHRISVVFGTLRARGLLGRPVGICMPSSMASYRVLEFPFTDARRIAQTVAFEADGQFPQPLESLAHGHMVIPGQGPGGKALLVASPKDRVGQVAAVFRRAGSDVKVVTSAAVAAGQVATSSAVSTPEMAELGRQPATLLLDLGHSFTQMVALGPKGPVAVRSVRRGGKQITRAIAAAYKLSFEDAEAAKHADAFLPHRGIADISPDQLEAGKVVARAIEPLLRELEQTRLWLRSAYNLEVAALTLCGGGADLSGLGPYLSEQVGLPVTAYAPSAPGLKVSAGKPLAAFASAIGAAYGAARRPLVQLHDTSALDAGGGWVQERMTSLIAIGVAIMAFSGFDTVARMRAAETELAAYELELATATLTAFGVELDAGEVSDKLAEADGQDLTRSVPEHGALETLAKITKAATPSDLGSTPAPGAVPTDPGSNPAAGGDVLVPGESPPGVLIPPGEPGALPAEGEDAEAAPVKVGPISPDAGIVMVDDLTIALVEVRERKIEIKASANQGSAQDRLATKLGAIRCISAVSKGKVRGNERKTFQMTMDSTCFAKAEAEEAEESDQG